MFSGFSFGSGAAKGGKLETFTLQVNNNTDLVKQYNIFGPQGWSGAQQGGVSVTVPESSLGQATRESLFRGYMIKNMKIRSTNPDQFSESLVIRITSMTGKQVIYPVQFTNFQSPMSGNANLIEMKDVNIPVYGDVNFTGNLQPNTNMTILLDVQWLDQKSNFTNEMMDTNLDKWVNDMNNQTQTFLAGNFPFRTSVIVNTQK